METEQVIGSRKQAKKKLRKEMLEKRNALSLTERTDNSRAVIGRLFQWEPYVKADSILCYVSYQSEVQTWGLLQKVLSDGKRLYCPKVCGKEIEFYRIVDREELRPGYQGIPEPPEVEQRSFWKEEVIADTLMLMPGVAFDLEHNRLGYGGGYYDRYLKRCRHLQQTGRLHTAALAYAVQVVKEIPAEELDIKPETIITENGLLQHGV